MYLSKIELNIRSSAVSTDLSDCHKLHQRVMQGFPNENNPEYRSEAKILYRLEGSILFVQSKNKPDWTQLPKGYTAEEITEMDYEKIKKGDYLYFRLLGNPVQQTTKLRTDDSGNIIMKNNSEKPQKKTVRRFLSNKDAQIQWLMNHLKGTILQECYVSASSDIRGQCKQSKRIFLKTVLFDGVLQVTDSESFIKALREGIGRGRSYGCGLLSIAKFNPN
ncbi:CRISPR-associated protein, Cse3 family [Gloeothece citriformis PCC 7424]|uniref:CRISPR-associated protein, Cse3 family n=1 Tax=Gloeothece citriformis (strain PCC 7424) TaxID=65393 RepID=B7KJ27_GLOC7|nr:type I-E CRISPR-associated protein Cas6/Cse3/CasE [Gloeothece citriformis]ACK70863.1 CRISPR-associated protein, Cse3 family [Gloeothece citriformis PCC 7424]